MRWLVPALLFTILWPRGAIAGGEVAIVPSSEGRLGAWLALEGAGLFPGKSALIGDHKWMFYGACLALGGLVLLRWSRGPSRRHR